MEAVMQNAISDPLCHGGILGTCAVTVFAVYLLLRFGWVIARFRRAIRVEGSLVHFDVDHRRDLPEGDLKRLPEYLTYKAIHIAVEYEWNGEKYTTKYFSYWDLIGMVNVSGKLLQDMRRKSQSGPQIQVFVDPRAPNRAVVYRSVAGVALVEVAILGVALGVLAAETYYCAESLPIENTVMAAVVGIVAGFGGILDSVIKVRRRL